MPQGWHGLEVPQPLPDSSKSAVAGGYVTSAGLLGSRRYRAKNPAQKQVERSAHGEVRVGIDPTRSHHAPRHGHRQPHTDCIGAFGDAEVGGQVDDATERLAARNLVSNTHGLKANVMPPLDLLPGGSDAALVALAQLRGRATASLAPTDASPVGATNPFPLERTFR